MTGPRGYMDMDFPVRNVLHKLDPEAIIGF